MVVTAEEIIDIVDKKGPVEAARQWRLSPPGHSLPCALQEHLLISDTVPPIKASKVWLNNVPAYAGIAAVDCYIGATEPCEDDPLNKVWPGEFNYGGGHVIEDLVAGKKVHLKATAYGTSCYPIRIFEKKIWLAYTPQRHCVIPETATKITIVQSTLQENHLHIYGNIETQSR